MNPKIKSFLFLAAFVASATYYHQMRQEPMAHIPMVKKEMANEKQVAAPQVTAQFQKKSWTWYLSGIAQMQKYPMTEIIIPQNQDHRHHLKGISQQWAISYTMIN